MTTALARNGVRASSPPAVGPSGLPVPVPAGGPVDALAELAREISGCTLCPLSRSRTHVVVYRGAPAPHVVFVGEAPGAEEDRLGVPFVGRSGRLLDRAMDRLGPGLGPYGVLNVLKCRPPANRFDARAAVTCRPYLDRQLALLRPRVLVPLGARALHTLEPNAPPILQAAGTPRPGANSWVFPLVHPAAGLRSRRLRDRWEHDVQRLGDWLERPSLEIL